MYSQPSPQKYSYTPHHSTFYNSRYCLTNIRPSNRLLLHIKFNKMDNYFRFQLYIKYSSNRSSDNHQRKKNNTLQLLYISILAKILVIKLGGVTIYQLTSLINPLHKWLLNFMTCIFSCFSCCNPLTGLVHNYWFRRLNNINNK